LVERINKVLPLTPSLTALDFGAGTGLATLQLLPKIGFVYTLDPSTEMLDVFRKAVADVDFRNYEIVHGVIADFRGPPVDFVVCSASLHHTPDPWKTLHDLSAIVKPGGWIFLVVAREKLDLDALPDHLRSAGFTDVTSEHHLTVDVPLPTGVTITVNSFIFSAKRSPE
jgi:ubiquinone/menaquinone biosynthesis C-methylase UbiE